MSLYDFKGSPIGMMVHEGPSTSSGDYTSMISVNIIWYLRNDTNLTVVV